jgi:predicted RNA binding protein YcfA (HicA-like mRNA interferase family)
MPKAKSYKDVIKRLIEYDERFEIYIRKGKGSHRTIYHPDVRGRAESYPLKYHGDKTEIASGHLTAIIRRFGLPRDFFN